MIKILHSADWHLDSPLRGFTDGQREALHQALLAVPEKLAALCCAEHCDLVLLAGDLFDGAYTRQSYQALYSALEEMAVPVFITPGNHDFTNMQSLWLTEKWPENVHIFTRPVIESVDLPDLNCRIYGAGFTGMDCAALLMDFRAQRDDRIPIGIFHGDPATAGSPYNPVTRQQIQLSGLQYLALGHIHKQGSIMAGNTLCAWPGCPMGRGYDEQGEKGALLVTLEEQVSARFVPLDTPRFYDLQCNPENLDTVLPAAGSDDYYRITLTGMWNGPDADALKKQFSQFPNLELRDNTIPPVDVWERAGRDNFEGIYFGLLKQAWETASEPEKDEILLAAELSQQLLEGQEVVLP